MRHEEFRVGMEFWCGGHRWRCTDVGTRVVIAMCLEPHEVVTVTYKGGAGDRTIARTTTSDESWFNGPPYAVPEHVFDEYSFEGCTLSPDVEDE